MKLYFVTDQIGPGGTPWVSAEGISMWDHSAACAIAVTMSRAAGKTLCWYVTQVADPRISFSRRRPGAATP